MKLSYKRLTLNVPIALVLVVIILGACYFISKPRPTKPAAM